MENPRTLAFAQTAQTIIKQLERRNMEGYFCETSADAVELVRKLVPAGASIAWGGTETFKETGVKSMLEAGDYRMIDRAKATTPEEAREILLQHFASDCFFMSANAITRKGELVNIDGNSNRLACLLHGPREVYVLVGMNKVVEDVDAGIKRIHTTACPPNAARLHTDTPCERTGVCGNCHEAGCMCWQRGGHATAAKPAASWVIRSPRTLGLDVSRLRNPLPLANACTAGFRR